jgi:hypothetical protein
MKERLARLKDELEQKAQSAIKKQLGKPVAPWQKNRVALNRKVPPSITPRFNSVLSRRVLTKINQSKQIKNKFVDDFKYWEMPLEVPVRQPPPTKISENDLTLFQRIVTDGSAHERIATGTPLFATVGLDFGTSSTKVIVRFPYEPGTPAVAIPAPNHCRCEGNLYLWQTVLWIRSDGQFIAWPETGTRALYSLKQGIVGGKPDALIEKRTDADLEITRSEAATAFLAFVISYVRGWLHTYRPKLFRGRDAVWFVNVGLPAANFDNGPLLCNYRRIASAAFLMASFGGPLNLAVAKRFLRDEKVEASAKSEQMAQKLGVAIVPETAAEATGFIKSTRSAPGLYLMIDVGAMTLDVCTFRFWNPDPGQNQYSLFTAQVRPLGVEAFHWFIQQGKEEKNFAYQCDRCMYQVVWHTKVKRTPMEACWTKGNSLPVFLVGGGSKNELHLQRVKGLSPWLKEHSQNDGIKLLELPTPANIDLPEPVNGFHRLAVAWGLSYPPTEIGIIRTPSKIPDVPPLPIRDWRRQFVSKDLV